MDWKKHYVAHSTRVKSLHLHPSQPWVVTGLYAGHLAIYEYTTEQLIHKIEVCNAPIRCCCFVAERDWVVCGNDEGMIFIYNSLTQERLHTINAHGDYLRCIAVHPTLPLMLSCADDMEIHCWNLDSLTRVTTFVGHQDYVMQVAWAPRSESCNALFASCSLDGTIKFWSVPQKVLIAAAAAPPATPAFDQPEVVSTPNFTLSGHEKGVNNVFFSTSMDKPYVISGSDDCTVKVWDYQNRQCLQTLYGHESNVSCAIFHPYLPILITCCEQGLVKIWNSSTYKCTQTHALDMGRLWLMDATKNAVMNYIAVATDEGLYVATLGRNRPLMTLHTSGRLVMVKGNDFQSINLKQVDEQMFINGKRILVQAKDMGSGGDLLYPHSVEYSPNGRYLGVHGGGSDQYSILTSQALRIKHYGDAHHFTWLQVISGSGSAPPVSYATAITSSYTSEVSIHDDDGNLLSKFIPSESVVGLYGNGPLLGVAHDRGVTFYHPQSLRLVARVEASEIIGCYWEGYGNAPNESEDQNYYYAVLTDTRVLIYTYRSKLLEHVIAENIPESDEGIPEAFELVEGWVQKGLTSGLWVGKAFFYSTEQFKLYIYTLKQRFEYCSIPGSQYLLAYLAFTHRLITTNRDCKLTSFWVDPVFVQLLASLESLRTIGPEDPRYSSPTFSDGLAELMEAMSVESREFAVTVLRNNGFPYVAMKFATNPDTKFQIALGVGEPKIAADLLKKGGSETRPAASLKAAWTEVGNAAVDQGLIDLAVEAFEKAEDFGALALLALSLGDFALITKVARQSADSNRNNIAYLAAHLSRDHNLCLDLLLKEKRYAEAAIYARAFKPSRVKELAALWEENEGAPVNTVDSWKDHAKLIDVSEILEGTLNKYTRDRYSDYAGLCGFDFLEEFDTLGKEEFVEALMP